MAKGAELAKRETALMIHVTGTYSYGESSPSQTSPSCLVIYAESLTRNVC